MTSMLSSEHFVAQIGSNKQADETIGLNVRGSFASLSVFAKSMKTFRLEDSMKAVLVLPCNTLPRTLYEERLKMLNGFLQFEKETECVHNHSIPTGNEK